MHPAMDRDTKPGSGLPLRRGWTTGACATAATKAALTLLATGQAPDPVSITLPKGETPSFAIATEQHGPGWASIGIIKDAGDDPDVTHGALISVRVSFGAPGKGIRFVAGTGVGTVTRPGLPIPPGEPAINPVPRSMMTAIVSELSISLGCPLDVVIEISVPGGAALARKTWNPRLGIEGGISILGTTGIVHPFSCSAWIHSIHSGVDVARAAGLARICGATGSTSEAAAQKHFALPDIAMIDMGDFAGGMLKYLRTHPVPEVTIAGGFGKLCKLAQGFMDLHSGRSQVDFEWLAQRAKRLGAGEQLQASIVTANTAAHVLALCQGQNIDIAAAIAVEAKAAARKTLRDAPVQIEILLVGRNGEILAHAE